MDNKMKNNNFSFGWGVLGFFIPLVGLLLFILWGKDKPDQAKASGIGALIGIVLNLIIFIAYWPK